MTEETTEETTPSTTEHEETTQEPKSSKEEEASIEETQVTQESEETASEETASEETASEETVKEASQEEACQQSSCQEESASEHSGERLKNVPRVHSELHQLVDLSTKYPDIGPVVAKLANKLGYTKIAERVLRLGLKDDVNSIEYYFVAARLAREEGRKEEALEIVLKGLDAALQAFKEGHEFEKSDRSRLLHVVRIGFATLMFEFDDIHSQPEFSQKLSDMLADLGEMYGDDAFYHQLYAQALWFGDVDASEDQWEIAVKYGEPEDVWNARGTWYKEASKSITKAEAAYRRGLEKTAESALLMHNLAQVIMDQAEAQLRIDIPRSAILLNEAEGYLRKAKRFAHRHAMRSHVYETFDRLRQLKASIEASSTTPEVGDVVTGRVISTKNYGAFIVLPSGHTGLLHSSEIDHYWVEDATTRYNENDAVEVKVIKVEERTGEDGFRISLSRKALIEKPADFDESLAKPPSRRNKPAGRREDAKPKTGGGRRGDESGGKSRREGSKSGNRGGRKRGRKDDTPSQYTDSGTGVTIADLLSAKLNLHSKDA